MFSIAMTAWSAKVRTSSTCRSVNGFTRQRPSAITPVGSRSLIFSGPDSCDEPRVYQACTFKATPSSRTGATRPAGLGHIDGRLGRSFLLQITDEIDADDFSGAVLHWFIAGDVGLPEYGDRAVVSFALAKNHTGFRL